MLADICVLPKEACDVEKPDTDTEDEDDFQSEVLVYEKSMYTHTGDLVDQKNKMGAWEVYTRGIGSKLLQKMGWNPGEGTYKLQTNFLDF